MSLTPPPMQSHALAEISGVALRWLAGFDPFGSFGGQRPRIR